MVEKIGWWMVFIGMIAFLAVFLLGIDFVYPLFVSIAGLFVIGFDCLIEDMRYED